MKKNLPKRRLDTILGSVVISVLRLRKVVCYYYPLELTG